MSPETIEELRELRARAYGPDPDIADDPEAMRRLRELEDRQSGNDAAMDAVEPAVDSSSPPPPLPAAIETPAPTTLAATPLPAPAEQVPVDGDHLDASTSPTRAQKGRPHRTKRATRRLRIWWALSLVAACTLTAFATHALTSFAPVSVSSGAEQIATLEPSTEIELPSGWFGAGPSSQTYEFYGVILFQSAYGYGMGGGSSTDCVTAVPEETLPEPDADPNNWSINGSVYSGCKVGSFPATVEMAVDTNSPEDLSAQFPRGSALQFVVDGDKIGVFYSAAP